MMKTEDVKISEIKFFENVRISSADKTLVGLMQSIKQHGLLQPIGLTRDKLGTFTLVYGHRRVQACKKLGWVTIPAVVGEALELKDHFIINITENLQRLGNSPLELGRACSRMMNELKMTKEEIAVRLSVKSSTIQSALDTYHNVPRELRSKVVFVSKGVRKEGSIPATFVQYVANMNRVHRISAADMKQVLEASRDENFGLKDLSVVSRMVKDGLNVKQAMKKIKDFKSVTCAILVDAKEMDRLVKKYKMLPQTIIAKIVYGELPTLKKPEYVSNALVGDEK